MPSRKQNSGRTATRAERKSPTRRASGNGGAGEQIGRLEEPMSPMPAFVYFASEIDSSYVTGEVLTLLGGETTAA